MSQKLTRTDGKVIKFDVWDTAGQERYHSLAPMYYRGAKAAIIVYDITSISSFVRAKEWALELRRFGNDAMVICLAGNKADMKDKVRFHTSLLRYDMTCCWIIIVAFDQFINNCWNSVLI